MADTTKKTEAPAAAAPEKKKLPIKPLLVLLAVALIEGVAIGGAFLLFGPPAPVQAEVVGAEKDEALKLEEPIEERLVADRFPNSRTGRMFLYDVEVVAVIKRRHQELVKKQMEARKAQIQEEIRIIIGRAEPELMGEPTLATLKRQVKAVMDERIGRDPQDGTPYIVEVRIPKCTRFPGDF